MNFVGELLKNETTNMSAHPWLFAGELAVEKTIFWSLQKCQELFALMKWKRLKILGLHLKKLK